jgi:hypothetical protein
LRRRMHAWVALPLISFVASTEYDTHASSSSYDTHASSSSYDMHASLIASTEAVAERVCGGERLTRPGECPEALWALLQRTWAELPADRPTFVEVAGALVVLRVNQPSEVHGVEQQVFVAAGAREAQVSSFSYDMHASSSSYDMHVHPPPHMTGMHPPPHMTWKLQMQVSW